MNWIVWPFWSEVEMRLIGTEVEGGTRTSVCKLFTSSPKKALAAVGGWIMVYVLASFVGLVTMSTER